MAATVHLINSQHPVSMDCSPIDFRMVRSRLMAGRPLAGANIGSNPVSEDKVSRAVFLDLIGKPGPWLFMTAIVGYTGSQLYDQRTALSPWPGIFSRGVKSQHILT